MVAFVRMPPSNHTTGLPTLIAHNRDQLVTLTTMTPPTRVRLVGITLDHGLLRTVPEKTRRGYGGLAGGGGADEGFIDLQPDGNSFDMLAGLIKTKGR